jgi:hypothetical protein
MTMNPQAPRPEKGRSKSNLRRPPTGIADGAAITSSNGLRAGASETDSSADDDDERPDGLGMQPRRIGGPSLSTIAHTAVAGARPPRRSERVSPIFV